MRLIDKLTVCIIAFLVSVGVEKVEAQSVAVRNNLLYDATLTPNLGVDLKIDSLWTVGAVVGVNAWDYDKQKNEKWRHLLIATNIRRWLDKEPFHKNYIEGDLIYSHFNVGNTTMPFSLYDAVKERRLQGDLIALGGKYGYSWILARHWRVEAEAGIAVGYAWFKEYECDHCGTYYGKGDRIFLLPQLGVNVVYIIN